MEELHIGKSELLEPQKDRATGLLEEAYGFVKEHKVETGLAVVAIGGLATLGARALSRRAANAESIAALESASGPISSSQIHLTVEALEKGGKEYAAMLEAAKPTPTRQEVLAIVSARQQGAQSGEKILAAGQHSNPDFRAGQGLLKAVDGSPLPDISRPFLADGSLNAGFVAASREAYAGDLCKLLARPASIESKAGESLGQFAERTLKDRVPLTGERLSAEAVEKEASRLAELNQLTKDAALNGEALRIFDEKSFAKTAEEMAFKHVPQIGQFLKGTGKITEEQIEQALAIQRGLPKDGPRKLIGEILVENKLALQSDVDKAFANQQELKTALKDLREKFLETLKH
ncbi:MAG: hypothetical protein K2X27_14700 [Candidatus Obscuribacterales bacterium]|nr:hypothetical protein [Candidatus Obscuribacterales bacterium]